MISCLLNGEFFNGIEPFRPIVDGVEFTDQPFELFKQGMWNTDKSLVIGVNEQEMSYVSAVLRNIPIPKNLFEVSKISIVNCAYKKELLLFKKNYFVILLNLIYHLLPVT